MGCEEAVYEADLVGDKESECQADQTCGDAEVAAYASEARLTVDES